MCWCYLLFIILWERLLAFSLTNSVHSHWIFYYYYFLYISLRFWWITPGIPVGFTAIFIMFSNSDKSSVKYYKWLLIISSLIGWNRGGCCCRSQKDKIFIFLAAPAAMRRARVSGRIFGARAPLALPSAPPAKLLAVCRFPHVSHWKWTRHSRLPRPVWKGLYPLWEGVNVRLLDHCQVSSLLHYCGFKEQEIPRIYTVGMVINWNSNVNILIF